MHALGRAPVRIMDDVRDSSDFLDLATSLGNPIVNQDGTVVRELKVTDSEAAKPNTLSSRFGKGIFPFHTDTAFWTVPARWLLLRFVSGDSQRPTYCIQSEELIRSFSTSLVRRSAWICSTGTENTYSTITFQNCGSDGFRYDPVCMKPANNAAREIDAIFRPRCFEMSGIEIKWIPNRVAIIDNWSSLHARGRSTATDQSRVLQRIYLR